MNARLIKADDSDCHLKSPRSNGGAFLYPTNQHNEQWQLTSAIILNIPSAVKRLTELLQNDMRHCYLKHNAAVLRDVICTSGWIINQAKLWEYGWTLQVLLASLWLQRLLLRLLSSNRWQSGIISRCGAGAPYWMILVTCWHRRCLSACPSPAKLPMIMYFSGNTK